MKLILGSSSRSKRKVLSDAGYKFETIPIPDTDYRSLHRSPDPYELADRIAKSKAEAVLNVIGTNPAIIIVSYQLVLHMNFARDKPRGYHEAYDFLSTCHTKEQKVVTVVCVTSTKSRVFLTGMDVAIIELSKIPERVILKYLNTSAPFLKAGGINHKDSILKPYIKNIRGSDDSLVGMPLGIVSDLIKRIKNLP